jgi:hypothetical protein
VFPWKSFCDGCGSLEAWPCVEDRRPEEVFAPSSLRGGRILMQRQMVLRPNRYPQLSYLAGSDSASFLFFAAPRICHHGKVVISIETVRSRPLQFLGIDVDDTTSRGGPAKTSISRDLKISMRGIQLIWNSDGGRGLGCRRPARIAPWDNHGWNISMRREARVDLEAPDCPHPLQG